MDTHEDMTGYMQMYDELQLRRYEAMIQELKALQDYLLQRGVIRTAVLVTRSERKRQAVHNG